jgi:hypothetical protein
MDVHHLSPYACGIMGTCHVSYFIFHFGYFSHMDRTCYVISSLSDYLWCVISYAHELSYLRVTDICSYVFHFHTSSASMRCHYYVTISHLCMIFQSLGTHNIDNYFIYTKHHQHIILSNVKKLEFS